MQIQCPKCKQWTDNETAACQFCGTSLTDNRSHNEKHASSAKAERGADNSEPSKVLFLIPVVLVTLVGLICTFAIDWPKPDPNRNDPDNTVQQADQTGLKAAQLLKEHKELAKQINESYHFEIELLIMHNNYYAIPVDKDNASMFKDVANTLYRITSHRNNPLIPSTLDTSNLNAETTDYCLLTAPGIHSPANADTDHPEPIKLYVRRDETGKYILLLALDDASPNVFGIFYPREIRLQLNVPIWYGADIAQPKGNAALIHVRKTADRQWEELVLDAPDLLKHFDLKKSKPMGSPITTVRMIFPVTCELCYESNYLYLVYREFMIDRKFQECYEKLVPSPIPGAQVAEE